MGEPNHFCVTHISPLALMNMLHAALSVTAQASYVYVAIIRVGQAPPTHAATWFEWFWTLNLNYEAQDRSTHTENDRDARFCTMWVMAASICASSRSAQPFSWAQCEEVAAPPITSFMCNCTCNCACHVVFL
jgi:hypothetical protein